LHIDIIDTVSNLITPKKNISAMQKRRIPQVLPEFSAYLGVVAKYLGEIMPGSSITRGEYLGMTPAEIQKLTDMSREWHSNDQDEPGLYDRHCDPAFKTSITRAGVVSFRKEFGEFFQPILNMISTGRNTTNDDRLTLHIALPVTTRSRREAPITEQCIVTWTLLTGGHVKFMCHAAMAVGRAKKPQYADALEFAYLIETPVYQETEPGKPRQLIIKDHFYHDSGFVRIVSTKATFTLKFGMENSGQHLHFFARWICTRHPELNGPLTGPRMLTIV
jgi:hypothetical protein